MPAFLQRLRRSFQERSRMSGRIINPRISSAQQNNSDQDNADASDDDDRKSSDRRLPPLPVIKDAGPPTANRYANSDIFWNSVMVEADDDERIVWESPRKASLTRRYTDRSKTTEIEPQDVAPPLRPAQRMASGGNNASASQATSSKHKQIRTRGLQRLQRNLSYGKERADNDLTVMMFTRPDYTRRRDAPNPHLERPPEPLSPGTQQWDEFMDFPMDNSLHRDPAEAESSPTVPVRATSPPGLGPILKEGDHLSAARINHTDVPASEEGPIDSTILTWDTALNRIINHEAVDPDVGYAIRDRVKTDGCKGSRDKKDFFHVPIAEAGLVPNFSYPVAAAAFYDRLDPNQSQIPLTNGIESEISKQGDTNEHAPVDGEPLLSKTLLNGISSSSSSVRTDGTLNRPRSPDWTEMVPQRVKNLLREVLTASELSLCNEIIKASTTSTLKPETTPGDETDHIAASTIDIDRIQTQLNAHAHVDPTSPSLIRLVAKLHTLLLHLQDRATYLEDNLLPILGTALERKTFTIDVMSIEVQNLGDQINALKTAVDFSNKVLAGCWLREYEVWRTLVTIREKRERKNGKRLLRRLTQRKNRIADGVLSPLVSDTNGKEKLVMGKQALRKTELDALIWMAEQNVQVLREDVDDMVEQVEKCKRSVKAFEKVPTPEEGSWRDV
ncbi:hypothetical protein FB567DRAFT_53088 [Paraphoma chrysanthemicola]|uniref:Uncharacterized protein n=1 Tax=Paraphoma chrysanthemicola TaxID=798071 RepID=A0A8K0VYW2_9PLEO|nr:hypothetical protein FB567DRAFT_53088 [Paraphoma chrysanthemicola]